MKILFLAPHPFYQDRGTPIAVDLFVRVLAERGDTVDILTYHEGSYVNYNDNVKIHRINKPPFVSKLKAGFSLKKIICDSFMLPKALKMAKSQQYDIIHAVEESVFMAMLIRTFYSIPYICDMDSSMPQQIVDKFTFLRFLRPLMDWFEKRAVQKSMVVIAVCDALAQLAKKCGATKITILRDISLIKENTHSSEINLKKDLNINGICFLYLGNLEKYQGIDLLLESFAIVLKQTERADLVIAGGAEDDINKYKAIAEQLGIAGKTHFIGPKPIQLMGELFKHADVLVSPRILGGNTPMKIYSYLDSGKAIIATDLDTHTQVLNDHVSILEPPEPKKFARGMIKLIQNNDLRIELGGNAKTLAIEKYSLDAYRQTVNNLYDWITLNLNS